MPKLIRNIQGVIYLPYLSSVNYLNSMDGEVGKGDYFKVFKLEVFQQDFSRVENYDLLNKPRTFGLRQRNKTFIELEISY